MKILLDKPAPNPANTGHSNQQTNGFLDLLTGGMFSNTLNDMQEQTISEEDSDQQSTPQTVASTIDDLDAIMNEIMQQLIVSKTDLSKETESEHAMPAAEMAAGNVDLPKTEDSINQSANPSIYIDNQHADTLADNSAQSIKELQDRSNNKQAQQNETKNDESEFSLIQLPDNHENLTPSVKLSDLSEKMSGMRGLDNKAEHNAVSAKTELLQNSLQNWLNHVNNSQPNTVAVNSAMQIENKVTNADLAAVNTKHTSLPEMDRNEAMSLHLDKIELDGKELNAYHVIIKVAPPELGPVHARLKINKDSVDIKILTTNPQAEQLIKHHMSALVDQFANNSMKLDKIEIQQQQSLNLSQGQDDGSQSRSAANQLASEAAANEQLRRQSVDKSDKKSEALIDAYI